MQKMMRRVLMLIMICFVALSFGDARLAEEERTAQEILDEIYQPKAEKLVRYTSNIISYDTITLEMTSENRPKEYQNGRFFINDVEYELKVRGTVNGIEDTVIPCQVIEDDGKYILILSKDLDEPNGKYQVILQSVDRKQTATSSEMQVGKKHTQEFEEYKGMNVFQWIWAGVKTLWGDYEQLMNGLVEAFARLLTSPGDSFLKMICDSVGEAVTIDGVVYDRIEKLDVNFFEMGEKKSEAIENEPVSLKTPMKNILAKVINPLYSFFRNIVIIVYMAMLVYIGIKILLTSTAEGKVEYKGTFMAWVMGVVMLFFFPYVMHYAIKLNSALCTYIGGKDTTYVSQDISTISWNDMGTDRFVEKMLHIDQETGQYEDIRNNAMLYVRYIGAHKMDVPLLVVYFIFIGQLFAILIIYYKRVFMLAFLITIFPLVVMLYPLSRTRDIRMNPFGIWFKEFMINVFVQSFHAATYKTIVTIGIASYVNAGNVLFMIMCILFLFEGEKILRAIFNAKSSANTIGDMAMAGLMAKRLLQGATDMAPKGGDKAGKKATKDISPEEKAKKDLIKPTPTVAPDAATNLEEATGGIPTGSGSGSGGSGASSTGGEGMSMPRKPYGYDAAPIPTMERRIQEKRDKSPLSNLASGMAHVAGSAGKMYLTAAGTVLGGTLGMAQTNSQTGLNTTISGLISGKSLGSSAGQTGQNLLEGGVEHWNKKRAGRALAREYIAGEHDEELDLSEADTQLNTERARLRREAYARAAKLVGKGKNNAAQIRLIQESIERNNNE